MDDGPVVLNRAGSRSRKEPPVSLVMTKSLRNTLMALCLAVSLIPIAVVAYLSYSTSRSTLEEAVFSKLTIARACKKQAVGQYLQERVDELKIMALRPDVTAAFATLRTYHDRGGVKPDGPYDIETEDYREVCESIDPLFRRYIEILGHYDLFLICAAHGHVMYTVAREADLGTNLRTGLYRGSGLAHLWAKVVQSKRAEMVDYAQYEPSDEPAAFVGAPLLDEDGSPIAVLAIQLSTKHINKTLADRTGMGETGEAYLVGPDLLMRTDSRFEESSSILKTKVDTVAVRKALDDQEGTEIITDYRGEPVLSSYSHLGLNEGLGTDFDWAVICETDEAEALAPVRALRRRVISVGAAAAVLVGLIGYLAARGIAKPVTSMSQLVLRVSEGDLSVDVSHNGNGRADEIGVLGKSFTAMVENLRSQTGRIRETANVLGSASREISTSVAQVTSSATQTSSAVAETSATVEEVKQTADVNTEKAKQVSVSAQQAADTSQTGEQAVGLITEEMDRIKQQMDAIADRVMNLSEQSQAIGEIIDTVDDLAEQSNLLAVNAAVEAAKAGDQGKGFAVVAQEIKSLAEQSKESTKRVRSILSDVQKATGATVMATEQGAKAVDAGVKQAADAADAIHTLSASSEAAAESALQIAASSQQQLVGVDQVASAMDSIKQATTQNVDSMQQLDEAAQSLKDMSEKLVQAIEQYKL